MLFGAPMEHINFRDCAEFYELVPLETAVEVWNSTAHEGTLKALKHKLVGGKSVLERLRSPQCYEQALLSLYFDQLITKKELKERIELHFQDNKRLMDSFLGAIWGVKAGKSGSIQMVG